MHSEPSAVEITVRFPNRIAKAREVARLKVSELARIVDVSRSHLTKVEAGQQVPSAIILHDVAAALEVPFIDLFDEKWSADRRSAIDAAKAHIKDR